MTRTLTKFSVIILSVALPNVVFYCFAKYRHVECHRVKRRYDNCRYAECRGALFLLEISCYFPAAHPNNIKSLVSLS